MKRKHWIAIVVITSALAMIYTSRVWEPLVYRYTYHGSTLVPDGLGAVIINGDPSAAHAWTYRSRITFYRWSYRETEAVGYCAETGFMVMRRGAGRNYEMWSRDGVGQTVSFAGDPNHKSVDQPEPTAPAWVYDDSLFDGGAK